MKKAIIGGFITLIGSIWALALCSVAANNLTSAWQTPPGRFLTTLIELDIAPLFVISMVFVLLGIVLMGIEYFKRDN